MYLITSKKVSQNWVKKYLNRLKQTLYPNFFRLTGEAHEKRREGYAWGKKLKVEHETETLFGEIWEAYEGF